MADFLNKSEIDDLLNANLAEDSAEIDGTGKEATDLIPSPGTQKIFKPPKKDMSGMKFEYRSPVVKNGEYVYNPNGNPPNKIVVRSIFNYAEYLRKKKEISNV